MERGCDYERELEVTSFPEETKRELKELFDKKEVLEVKTILNEIETMEKGK